MAGVHDDGLTDRIGVAPDGASGRSVHECHARSASGIRGSNETPAHESGAERFQESRTHDVYADLVILLASFGPNDIAQAAATERARADTGRDDSWART